MSCPSCKNKKIVFQEGKGEWCVELAKVLRKIPFYFIVYYCPICGFKLKNEKI